MPPKPVTVRLDPEDRELLAAEAERLGVKPGTLSRMMIRAALRGGAGPPGSAPWPEAPPALAGRRAEVLRIAEAHGARNVRVFGSQARGDADPGSDVDLLVELEPGRSLLDLIGLTRELEDLLGRQVDVVTERGISEHLRARIEAEAEPL